MPLHVHSDMGEGLYISKQPESGVVGDSGGECPEQSVSQIEQCQKLGVSGAGGDAGCRGEYTGCLLERAGMLGEYMVVPCECMSTEAGLDGTGLGVLFAKGGAQEHCTELGTAVQSITKAGTNAGDRS